MPACGTVPIMVIAPIVVNQLGIELDGACAVPPWVSEMVGSTASVILSSGHNCELREARGEHFALVTVRVVGARRDDALTMQRRTAHAYETIVREIATSSTPHPVRFWNFIPDIRCEMGDGLDRYMVFNAGRCSALFDSHTDRDTLANSIATATGIGCGGDDLVIHALASDHPGIHIQNPRQRAPHNYSACFGPLPPCFARATVLPEVGSSAALIMLGGTASVCGEESVHLDDVRAQTHETFANLEHLIRSAASVNSHTVGQQSDMDGALLRLIDTLRVYYLRQEDRGVIEQIVRTHVSHLKDIEYLQADICRSELLVEIEGTARPLTP